MAWRGYILQAGLDILEIIILIVFMISIMYAIFVSIIQ